MNYTVLTYGCQMNVSDTERIHTMLQQAGFTRTEDLDASDLVVFNTCSVKQKAEDKVWGKIRDVSRGRKHNPNLRVAVTGCMVRDTGVHSRHSERFHSKDALLRRSDRIDMVFRIEDLQGLPQYLSVIYGKELGQDFDEENSYFQVRPQYESSAQVFVPVQTGCNKFCTYCIVPFTRKREISRPMEEIVTEVEELVAKGAKEVTLLGQTVNSYTHPDSTATYSDNNFVELLYRINGLPGLDRLRYTSPHPMDMDDELIRAHVELDKLCKHVHMPAQSGDTNVLRRMNRKYSREKYVEVINALRRAVPDIVVTTDIIVGFCGETEEEFMNTYKLFEELRFDMSFTSRYSEREGTYSAKRLPDDVAPEEKARRWHMLNDLLKDIVREKNKEYEGKTVEVLVERQLPDGRLEGFSREYKRVQFPGRKAFVGHVLPVKVTGSQEFVLFGETMI